MCLDRLRTTKKTILRQLAPRPRFQTDILPPSKQKLHAYTIVLGASITGLSVNPCPSQLTVRFNYVLSTSPPRGSTNPGRHVAVATTFFTVALAVCEPSLSNFFHVTLPVFRIFRCPLGFLEHLCTPDSINM